jgi:hypothetical protein
MSENLISVADQLIASYTEAWKRLYPGEDVPVVVKRRRAGVCRGSVRSKDGVGDFMSLDNFAGRINDMRYWARKGRAAA